MDTAEIAPGHIGHSLFFAAIPSEDVADRLAEAWAREGSGDSFRRHALHLSLMDVVTMDHLDEQVVGLAQRAAAEVRIQPFEMSFDRLMTFGGPPGGKALVFATAGQNAAVLDLAARLQAAVRGRGMRIPVRKMTPHITAAYGNGFAEARLLPEPIRWTVRDFTLIDSLQGKGQHVPLGTWPLAG